MEHYAGIDASLKESSVYIVDATNRLIREAKVASEPEALLQYFNVVGLPVTRISLEAGPLSQWLHAALVAGGREAVPRPHGRHHPDRPVIDRTQFSRDRQKAATARKAAVVAVDELRRGAAIG